MGTVFRPLSPTEYMYFPMRDLAPPFLMQMVVPGDGQLTADRLREAVRVAASVCPGARLRREGRFWVDTETPPPVREVAGHVLDYARLEQDSLLGSPLTDATCEVVLLTGDPVTVLFRVFHGVMDGGGMMLWARSVFAVLRGEQPLLLTDPVADEQLIQRVGRPGRAAPKMPAHYRSAVGHGRQERGEPRHLLRHRSIAGAPTRAVARLAALLADHAGTPARIMVPVDLRRHDESVRSTANLALPLLLDIAPGQPWQAVYATMWDKLSEDRELDQLASPSIANIPAPVMRALLRTGNRIGARRGRNLTSATISHLGRVDLGDWAVPGWKPTAVRVFPQHDVVTPLLFTMVEAGGRTELSVAARNGRGIAGRLEILLDRIEGTFDSDAARYRSNSEAGRDNS